MRRDRRPGQRIVPRCQSAFVVLVVARLGRIPFAARRLRARIALLATAFAPATGVGLPAAFLWLGLSLLLLAGVAAGLRLLILLLVTVLRVHGSLLERHACATCDA